MNVKKNPFGEKTPSQRLMLQGGTPYDIENRLKLRNPIYLDTASYGHMGRKSSTIKKEFTSLDGNHISCDVELFTWEKLDMIDKIKELIK